MRYSKERYERAEAELKQSSDRDAERLQQREAASEFDKLPIITYQHVAGVLDYLRGGSTEQARSKLSNLRNQAHMEALEFDRQHQALMDEVVRSWSSFEQAVDRLKHFESEMLNP